VKTGADVDAALAKIRAGGDAKYHDKALKEGKLFCRERLALLLDPGSFIEDAAFANSLAGDLPADGVVTGSGRVAGRTVCVMANDSTIKAGSWGARTVEKILRIQEHAERLRVPLVYLVDSAGARITDQIQMFPGRRGAGRIFHNQVRMSGMVPQVCLLFGPSAAGGAYIPAFCDVVIMVEGNASMYLGSPRMAEKVIGQVTTLEEMGGARMHCSVSGCGDFLVKTEREAIETARSYLGYMPSNCDGELPLAEAVAPVAACADLESVIPAAENKLFDMRKVLERIVDADSFLEVKKLFAGELLTGLARIDGRPIGLVANQPKNKGGVLFVDSADKAARFIWLCDAFGIPLLFLADVHGLAPEARSRLLVLFLLPFAVLVYPAGWLVDRIGRVRPIALGSAGFGVVFAAYGLLPLAWMPAARYQPYWRRMQAFALPSFYDGQIRINLRGRESHGRVLPEQFETVRDELAKLLLDCRDPRTGQKVVADIRYHEYCPPLELDSSAADISVVWNGSPLAFQHPKLGLVGPLPFRRPGGHSGDLGVAWIHGAGLEAADYGVRSAFDVVPTLLDLLEQRPLDSIDGSSLLTPVLPSGTHG